MLESGLSQLLISDPTVTSLIDSRIYPVVWPSDVPSFPIVTYQLISTVTSSVLSGPMAFTSCRVQYDVWSKGYSVGKQIAAAVNNVLEGFSGYLPDGTFVLNISLDSSQDLYDSPTSTNRVSSDYLVQFQRAPSNLARS